MNFPLKIAIVGPESTGKTTLAKQLAEYYETVWCPEYARTYLEELGRPYEESDLVEMAKGQLKEESSCLNQASKYLFCDTNLLVIKVWSEFKYGRCNSWILEHMNLDQYAIHFFPHTDVPWEDDPQREHPHKRQELWDIYARELREAGVKVVEIRGNLQERMDMAINAIEKLF